jgi:hypothetical protein
MNINHRPFLATLINDAILAPSDSMTDDCLAAIFDLMIDDTDSAAAICSAIQLTRDCTR